MHIALKILIVLPALLFLSIGLGWVLDPAAAAGNLGMPLLESGTAGLSTQIGDLGGFFTSLSLFMIAGVVTQNRVWFYSAASLLLLTAVFRVLAAVVHGASMETASIGIEIVVGALVLFAASQVGKKTA